LASLFAWKMFWFWPPAFCPGVGQLILVPAPPPFAYSGSNFLLNCSYLSNKATSTFLVAEAKASSKCFLVNSGTGSLFIVSARVGSNSIAAFYLASASILSLMAALAALCETSVKSAPEKPSVSWAMKFKSTSAAIGDFLRLALMILNLEAWSGNGM